jgi:hypothetical protein
LAKRPNEGTSDWVFRTYRYASPLGSWWDNIKTDFKETGNGLNSADSG